MINRVSTSSQNRFTVFSGVAGLQAAVDLPDIDRAGSGQVNRFQIPSQVLNSDHYPGYGFCRFGRSSSRH